LSKASYSHYIVAVQLASLRACLTVLGSEWESNWWGSSSKHWAGRKNCPRSSHKAQRVDCLQNKRKKM